METGLKLTAITSFGLVVPSLAEKSQRFKNDIIEFDVLKFGAVGDGKTLDTKAFQKAIDAAAEVGKNARVFVPSGHKYLIGTIELKSNLDFHLEGNAELLVSTNRADYSSQVAAVVAKGANNLTLSGTGSINGRALEFMSESRLFLFALQTMLS